MRNKFFHLNKPAVGPVKTAEVAGALPRRGGGQGAPIAISIVVPVCNEAENLRELRRRLVAVARVLDRPTELIFVDDGSTDGTPAALRAFSNSLVDIRVVELARPFGQHAALLAGFTQCRGDIIVTLDADLRNPPEEIPRLVAALEQGYDVVGSVRKDRQDSYLRKLSSRLVNRVVAQARLRVARL